MEPYNNFGGRSGVVAYEAGPDFIKLQFADGKIYRYTQTSAGAHNIAVMKCLAQSGQGLNTYINRYVRRAYAEQEH